MVIMAVSRIIVLSALITQTLSAPSGCIESCTYHQSSYQSRTLGDHQDHANLIQGSTVLNERDYNRPGNWTEHNQYNTDEGHGKVHEERGQYVDETNRVRYYKKNFTSSHGTGSVNEAGATGFGHQSSNLHDTRPYIPSSQHLESRSAYDQLTAGSVTGESGYNRMHNQRTQSSSSSSSRYDSTRSERLEDFGEHGGYSQVDQTVPHSDVRTTSDTRYHNVEIAPGNWSRADSYRTDGGRGRVFEEEGQYRTGPKQVRYYRKNYTSSYSASGVPQTDTGTVKLQDLHDELQQDLHKRLDNFRREFHQSSSAGHHEHVGAAHGLTRETVGFHSGDLQTAETDAYRQHLDHRHVPSSSIAHHHVTDQQQRETFTDTRQHLPYVYPSAAADTTENRKAYQSHETYVSRVHPVPQSIPRPSIGYVQLPATESGGYQTSLHNVHLGHVIEERQQAETSAARHSSLDQNQLLAENSRHTGYRQPSHTVDYPVGRRDHERHYEEHWSSSSSNHADGNLTPGRGSATIAHDAGTRDRLHYDRDAYNEQRGRHHNAGHDYNSRAHTSERSYDSAYRASSGQLTTGTLNLGQVAQGATDCTEETQQSQQETRYHRKYKRDEHNAQQTAEQENLKQQNQEFGQESQEFMGSNTDFTQQSEALDRFGQQNEGHFEFGQQMTGDQHPEDLTQQTEGQFELGQQSIGNKHSDHLTQQTDSQLEFGQQTVGNKHLEDLTQQTEDQLEFGQQTVGNKHLEDLTQQTEGQLEFGQQTVDNKHLEDLTQQTEGKFEFGQQTVGNKHLTQQMESQLEFGQQAAGNKHLEDLTQQTEGHLEFGQQPAGNKHLKDLTQQTEGHLEFGQQTVGNKHLEDLTQQTEGQLEFGQQTVGNKHLEDLTQQTEGQLEFGQQTVGNKHFEDLTQQTEGQLEFGQQPVGNKHLEDLRQQTEGHLEFGQQTVGNKHFEDLTQQTEGQLEFGQQPVGNKHLEDLRQQTEGHLEFGQQTVGNKHLKDVTQQTEGQLEFGQQTVDNKHLKDLTQQTEGQLEFGQQTVGNKHLKDLTQQTEGQLEFGQQTVGNKHLKDLTQQTEDQLEFGQQTVGNKHLEELTQQTEGQFEFGQQTVGNKHLEDLTQQTEGQFEFGQQTVGNKHLEDLTQQTEGQFEFGQQNVGNQRLEKKQDEKFAQQTDSDEYMQQTADKVEFGQHTQSTELTKPKNEHLEEFDKHNEDFTQQTDRIHDLTQQTMGKLVFGQYSPDRFNNPKIENQHMEDFTQQNGDFTQQVGGFNDFMQETMGHLEYGQQNEKQQMPNWGEYNTQHLERLPQRNDWNMGDMSQQSHQYPSFNIDDNEQSERQMSQKNDFSFPRQIDDQQSMTTGMMKPAPKPKPRQRYNVPSQVDETDTRLDDVLKPIEVNPEADIDNFGKESLHRDHATHPEFVPSMESRESGEFDKMENIDDLHKSNDATMGLQWHYNHHSSDLTNIENTRDNYYSRHNSMPQQTENQDEDAQQQQSKLFDFDSQETRGDRAFGDMYQQPVSQLSRTRHNDQQSGSFQQVETSSHLDRQSEQNIQDVPAKVIPLQQSENSQQASPGQQSAQSAGQTDHKIESRILEAYGGGPYDASRDDEIYRRVKPNPSATLPPIGGEDPWLIMEKPREIIVPWSVANRFSTLNTPRMIDARTAETTEITRQIIETTTQKMGTITEAPPSFWSRLGHKITSTYDKAKEKAKEYLG